MVRLMEQLVVPVAAGVASLLGQLSLQLCPCLGGVVTAPPSQPTQPRLPGLNPPSFKVSSSQALSCHQAFCCPSSRVLSLGGEGPFGPSLSRVGT